MNHKEFFEKHGGLLVRGSDLLFGLDREVAIEDLYQAFKARLLSEGAILITPLNDPSGPEEV